MARTELPVGWTQAGQSISVPFHHLTTLFGFKIYNTSDADLELTGLELSVSDDTRKDVPGRWGRYRSHQRERRAGCRQKHR